MSNSVSGSTGPGFVSPDDPGAPTPYPGMQPDPAAAAYPGAAPAPGGYPDPGAPTTYPPPVDPNGGQSTGGPADAAAAAKEQAANVAGTAKDQAAGVASSAVEQAQSVVGTAKEQAGVVTAEAKDKVSQLVRESTDQLRTQAQDQTDRLVSTLLDISDQFTTMGTGQAAPQGVVLDLTRQASDVTRRLAQTMEGRTPEELLEQARTFARRRPGVFLLGAVGAGFLAGRVIRALDTSAIVEAAKSGASSDGNGNGQPSGQHFASPSTQLPNTGVTISHEAPSLAPGELRV